MGRLNSRTYDGDATLRSLIDVAPFGLSAEGPRRTAPAVRGVVPGIGEHDKIVIWAGGLYDWFDPLTLIEAVGRLAPSRPDLRLYFLGTAHPSSDVPAMSMVERAQELSDRLGLTDRAVFFNEGWVDYDRRADYLLDADLGISTHAVHLETELSFRTRILDYIWAGLPIIATDGDSFAQLITERGLGRVVPEGDVDALVSALDECLYDAEFAKRCAANVSGTRPEFEWSRTLEPLVAFCRHPHRAADGGTVDDTEPPPLMWHEKLRADVEVLRTYLADGGVREVTRRAKGRVTRLMRERTGGAIPPRGA
jgi:glycosyltransferase involved in cell wall biosynthesis